MSRFTDVAKPDSVDCVVIGAGVVGATITQELSRRGVRTVVVDGAPGIGGGCSYANAAIVAPGHVTPLATPALLREAPQQMIRRPPAVRLRPDPTLVPWLTRLATSAGGRSAGVSAARMRSLAVDSTRLHQQLADQGLSPTFTKTGAVDAYLRPPRPRPHGFMSAEELRALEPTLTAFAGGTHGTEEWTLESRSFVTSMLDDAMQHGAQVRFSTGVDELVAEQGRVVGVRTSSGTVYADHVVLAAGLGSKELAAGVGLRMPLRGGRGYVIDLEAGDDTPSMPVRVKEHRVVVTPLEDRVRVCGSIEFGVEARPADFRRAEALRAVAARVLPGLRNKPVIDQWAGERPCTPDGVPVIGMAGSVDNVAVATGHGMWGMILAPITAQMIAQAICDATPESTPDWLRPERFGRRDVSALAPVRRGSA